MVDGEMWVDTTALLKFAAHYFCLEMKLFSPSAATFAICALDPNRRAHSNSPRVHLWCNGSLLGAHTLYMHYRTNPPQHSHPRVFVCICGNHRDKCAPLAASDWISGEVSSALRCWITRQTRKYEIKALTHSHAHWCRARWREREKESAVSTIAWASYFLRE